MSNEFHLANGRWHPKTPTSKNTFAEIRPSITRKSNVSRTGTHSTRGHEQAKSGDTPRFSFPVILSSSREGFGRGSSGCSSCNAHTIPKNRAKIVEEYVVSAKFDEHKNIPQLSTKRQLKEIYEEGKTNGRPEPKDASSLFLPFSSHGNHKDREHLTGDFESGNTLEERDLLVHHHLPPPPPPPPLPPPPPAGLAYAPSLFAVGLITFLILLNSLQTSLLLSLKSKGSVLGSVTGALGRKKRSALSEVYKYQEKYRNLN